MFQHTTVTGQSAYEHAICRGQRKPLPESDLSADPTAIKLFSPNSQHQDIKALYHDVYQLYRLPRWSRCEEVMAEQLCKEILDCIKECLRLKQPSRQQVKQWMQLLVDNPRPDPHTAFATTNQSTYEEMMALTRDAQQWSLVGAVILKE